MDFKKEFFKYLNYWPWFVLGVFLSVGAALFYLNLVAPVYESSASINIDKEDEKQTQAIVVDYKNSATEENPLSNEIMLLNSNEFLEKVVRSLQLNIEYFEKGYVQSSIAEDVPFMIVPKIANDSLPSLSCSISVTKQGYVLKNLVDHGQVTTNSQKKAYARSKNPFTIEWISKKNHAAYVNKEYLVKVTPITSAVKSLKESLVITADKNAKNTLVLSHSGINSNRSRIILKEIIVLLDENIISNKKQLFSKTVSFLGERINQFSKEKDSIEGLKERYLQNKDILVLDNYIADKTQDKILKGQALVQNEKQINFAKYAIKRVKEATLTATLGTDYNVEEPTVNGMLSQYNKLVLEGELLLQRAQKNNPAYQNIVLQLKLQKQLIVDALEAYLSTLYKINITNQTEQSLANSEANTIPTKDKILGNLNNDLVMKQGIYTTLLQTRETAILNGAVVESNLKMLNAPETNYSPIFPKKRPFLLGAFLFGLLLPFGIVYLLLALDTKIHHEEDILNQISDAAFLGTIPQVKEIEKLINTPNSRSLLAESIRSIFSNISYLLTQKQDSKGAVILVSSSIKGEGKSFTAYHTALTISHLNKKVLLIGADLRNPQLHDYFNENKNNPGLTHFLSNTKQGWKNLLTKNVEVSENLDILFAGLIPPNPPQLLTNTNFDLLIEEAKLLYDFIIIDSAPVQLVSDTLNFSHFADMTLFVVREDYTDRKILVMVKNLIEKGKLKNVGFVMNGVNARKRVYGYNYGYNYGTEQKNEPWYKKIKLGSLFS